MLTIKHRSLALVAATAAAFVNVAAVAPARAEGNQATVSYRGLDLASPAGAAILDRRIRIAAARVCGPLEPNLRTKVLACRQVAISNARASVPALSEPTQLAAR